MSVISVYRTFYWTKERLAGQTGLVWETKELQARCIKDPQPDLAALTGTPYVPPTEDQQRRDARYHISNHHCLCGIHGYFSPNYLGLVMVSAGKAGGLDHADDLVFARVRLGGLVDIRSLGARGEYALIEEAWCDADIAKAIAKQYDIPVNESEYNKQPRTDPIISGDAKLVKLSSLFAGMPEAMAMQNSLGKSLTLTSKAVGIQVVPMPKVTRGGQYMSLMGGPPPNPFGTGMPSPVPVPGSTPGFAAGGTVPPPPGNFGPPPAWASQMMRSIYNAKYAKTFGLAACSAPSGPSCQCGACAFRAAMGSGRSVPQWKCKICGTYEKYSSDHTANRCMAALPQLVPIPASKITTVDMKPGIVTRIKRAFGI